jgi:hypothetical protein
MATLTTNKVPKATGAAQIGDSAITDNGTTVAVALPLSVTGNATVSGYIDQSMGNGLTAVGNDRTSSLALTKAVNNVTTAAASTGVTLPAVSTVGVGGSVIIFNAGANPIQVYGAGSDTIDGAAAATGVPLTNAKRCIYIAVAAATWISAQLGVVSA